MDEITILQADVLRTLANARRLEIIHALSSGPVGVGRLAQAIGASQPNVSQHLAVLRGAGIVEAERDGQGVRYGLTDPDVTIACGLMRGVLERRLARLGAIATGAVAPRRTREPGVFAGTPGPSPSSAHMSR